MQDEIRSRYLSTRKSRTIDEVKLNFEPLICCQYPVYLYFVHLKLSSSNKKSSLFDLSVFYVKTKILYAQKIYTKQPGINVVLYPE